MSVSALLAALLFVAAAPAESTPPAVQDPFVSFGSLNRAFAVVEESPEYIASFRQLDPTEDSAVLDKALAAIFPDGVTTDEKAILGILAYIAQAIRLEASTTPLGSDIIKQGHGYCNGMALAFVALCRRAGLPARMNAFHNLEWMEAHNAAEVYYDAAWHFFDPTFGAFYYSQSAYDGIGRIPSLRELLANTAPRHGFQATQRLWQGDFDGRVDVQPIPADAKYGDYPFTLVEFHDRLFRQSFPVVPADDVASSYPLDLDLRATDSLWIGARDGKLMDQLGAPEEGRLPRFHGTPVLGKTRLGTALQTISLLVREPGTYRLTYYMAPGSRYDRMGAVELKNVHVTTTRAEQEAWVLECYVQEDPGLLLVANRYYFAAVDAILIERIPPEKSGTDSPAP